MSVLKFSFSTSSDIAVIFEETSRISVIFDADTSCAGQYAEPHLAMSASLTSVYSEVLPEERTDVLMMFPRIELHWKKKKKIPKNLTTTGSGSDPSRPANLWATCVR